LLLLSSLPAMAQDTPLAELGAGYTFRSLDVPFSLRLDMHGWNASVVFNLNNWLGVATEVDGTRGDSPDFELPGNDTAGVYTVLVGPRVYPVGHHRLTPFAHVLFGLTHSKITFPPSDECSPASSCTLTDGSFAFAVGGGLDATLTEHFGVRLVEFDYERTGMFQSFAPGTPDQNNYRIKAGILIRFGKR
jgi:opacity protein-like surface antigen